eukprot:EG_transcript_10160
MGEPHLYRSPCSFDEIPEGSPPEFDHSLSYSRDSSTSSDTAKPRTRVSFGQDQIRLYDASQPTQQLMFEDERQSTDIKRHHHARFSHSSFFTRLLVPLKNRKRTPKGPA